MNNINLFLQGDNQVNQEKPPPRMCPRCKSDNTKFCYYNNYTYAQPRYNCMNCCRYWTHGGALRNIPIGRRPRKAKRVKVNRPSVSLLVSVGIQQVNHHQPILNGGSSSSPIVVAVGNHFGSLPEIRSEMVLPFQSLPPMDHSDLFVGSFQPGYYDVGSTTMNMNHNGASTMEAEDLSALVTTT